MTTEILRTYRTPRLVMRRLLAMGPREDRALAYLMAACLVIFVGQTPAISRAAALDPEGAPLEARLAITFFAWLFIWPLLFYGIAGLSHLAARAIGGQGTWFRARLALFWTLLAVAPLMLLNGLVAGFIGEGTELAITGGVTVLAFFVLWFISLSEAEKPHGA